MHDCAINNYGPWHESEVRQPIAYVGYRGKTGKHLLVVSFTRFDPKRTLRAFLSVNANAYLRSFAHYHRAVTPTIGLRAQMSALAAADEPNPNRPTVVKTNANIQRSGPVNPGHQGTSPGKRTNSTNGMSANAMRMPFIQ